MIQDLQSPGGAVPNGLGVKLGELQSAALEATADAVVITDRAGSIVWANPAFHQLTGYNPEEAIGQSTRLLKSGHHPTSFYTSMWNAIVSGHTWRGHLVNRRKDGSLYDEAMTITPVPNGQGDIAHFIALKQDITEEVSRRRQAEESLRESEEQFRQLADNIRDVFFILSADPLRMSYISPAYDDIWGRPRQELYDRAAAWMDSIHPEDRERIGGLYAQSVQGAPSEMTYRVVRPDGTVRWINARSFPVRDPGGNLIRIVGIAEDVTTRKEKETALEEAHEKLNAALAEVERQAREAAKLTELVDILQSCQSAEEAYRITGSALQDTVHATSGALCMTSASRNVVEAVATWGGVPGTEKAFCPDDCWALRRGKIHRVDDPASPLRCAHVAGSHAGGHLCVPLAAQGETLGVLYLETPARSAGHAGELNAHAMEVLAQQALAVGERISLALANLRLREVLRGQSIQDPLTGLFNRRFMEESLEREFRRAVRGKQQLALLMLDIDRFKSFNDTFGHQAGDALLRALGGLLKARTRGQDVASRFGGEEFAFILAGASIDAARRRAEILREDIQQLSVRYAGQLLGAVTLSVGIAVFPDHADSAEGLLKVADDALYRAKAEGRDRIVVA